MADTDKPIRVLLVEDHTVVRQGLRALLESRGDILVVGESDNGEDAIEKACALGPDIVLMDLFLKGLSGIAAVERIVKKSKGVKVVVLSMYDDAEYVRSALRAGARGYLLKGSGISEITEAIHAVSRGGTALSARLKEKMAQRPPARPGEEGRGGDPLTPREKEILQLIAGGKTCVQAADALGISVKTVETHRFNLMVKLDIHNTAGLTRYAVAAGLVPPRPIGGE